MEQGDQIVTFETYYDPMLAEIIRARLEANGISCYLADGNMSAIMPIYNQAIGGVKLRVFARDLEKAKLLIEEDDSLKIEENSNSESDVTCPKCGSTNVRYGQATERKHSWLGIAVSFMVLVALFAFVYPFYAHKAWHCFNCGKDFN